MTRPVAIVGAAGETFPIGDGRNDAELLGPVLERALAASGMERDDVGLVVSAGSEFLNGVVGTVMGAFDVLPAWPPRTHTHLEGDGAFALFEAWIRLLAGEADVAVVCAFSRPLADDLDRVLALQLDPYTVGPLGAGPVEIAALQARALLGAGRLTESELAAGTRSTPCAGAGVVVLAAADAVGRSVAGPAWITGMDQRVESGAIGSRDLTSSPSTAAGAAALGLPGTAVDVLELHAPFSHQEAVLLDAIGAEVGALNPSGGALPADPVMVTGLLRVVAAAGAVQAGRAGRAVAHATNGPALQHNLLCLLEARL